MEVWYCDFSKNKAAQGAGLTVRDPDSSVNMHFTTLWQNSADGGSLLACLLWRLYHVGFEGSSKGSAMTGFEGPPADNVKCVCAIASCAGHLLACSSPASIVRPYPVLPV